MRGDPFYQFGHRRILTPMPIFARKLGNVAALSILAEGWVYSQNVVRFDALVAGHHVTT
jgi:hypothetical protein